MALRRSLVERLIDRVRGVNALPVGFDVPVSPLTAPVRSPGGTSVTQRRLQSSATPEWAFDDRDAWGCLVREALTILEPAERMAWMALFQHAATANAARPTDAWLKRAGERIAA